MLPRVTRVAKTSCSHSSLWSWSGERYLGFEKLEHLFPFQCCQIDFLHVLATYLQMFLPSSCHTGLNIFANSKTFRQVPTNSKKYLAKFLQFKKVHGNSQNSTKFLSTQKFLPIQKIPPSCRNWPQVCPG